jgi:hypothetical protein
MAVGTTQNTFRVRLILTVIMPEANGANLILPSAIKSLEFATWASECLGRLLRLTHPLYRLTHYRTATLLNNLCAQSVLETLTAYQPDRMPTYRGK